MDAVTTLLVLFASLAAAALITLRMRRPPRRHRVPLVPAELWLFVTVLMALLALAHLLHLLGLRGAEADWLR